MIDSQDCRWGIALVPASANAGSWTGLVIDTAGYDYCDIVIAFGVVGADATALKVQESDAVTNGTTLNGGADVTGLVFGTSTTAFGVASTLPTTATDAQTPQHFRINLIGRKRYLKVTATAGAAATLAGGIFCLSRSEEMPNTQVETLYYGTALPGAGGNAAAKGQTLQA